MLTPSQLERLDKLIEECAEIIHAACKIKNFGPDSTHPLNAGWNNRECLQNELGNLVVVLDLMFQAGDLIEDEILEAAEHPFSVFCIARNGRPLHHGPDQHPEGPNPAHPLQHPVESDVLALLPRLKVLLQVLIRCALIQGHQVVWAHGL